MALVNQVDLLEVLDFLDSIDGAGYGGMASFENALYARRGRAAYRGCGGDLRPPTVRGRQVSDNERTIKDRLADIYTWMREPDWTEEASLEWLMDWVDRRPVADLAMVAMLMPDVAVVPPADRQAGDQRS